MKDLLSFVVKSVAEIEHVMNVGNQNRSVGATNMNEHSSRSHAIFTIYIECSRKVKFSFFFNLHNAPSGHISKTCLNSTHAISPQGIFEKFYLDLTYEIFPLGIFQKLCLNST